MPIPGSELADETIFSTLNGCILGWALLAFAPHWKYTQGIVLSIIAIYCALYVATLLGENYQKMEPTCFVAIKGFLDTDRLVRMVCPQAQSAQVCQQAVASRLLQK